MSIYIITQALSFVICALLSTAPTKRNNKIVVTFSTILNIAGIILFGFILTYSKDNNIWIGGFYIPNLQYSLLPLPILIVLNALSFLYLFSLHNSNDIQSNIILISLINFHNSLLTTLLFVKELVTLFFVLEFISLTNIGFILSSNNPNKKEVAIKYFIQNIAAGILFVIGAIFFFRNTRTLELIPFVEYYPPSKHSRCVFSNLQYLLFFLFFFKLGIFPFHSWVSDVFQILNKNLYAILFALQKSILFFATGQFFYVFSTHKISYEFLYLLSIIIFLTILISIIGAISTQNLKRFLGYSSIYNAVFYLGLPASFLFNVNHHFGNYLFYMYLFTTFYMISTFVIFSIINVSLENFDDINKLSGIYKLIWIFFIANFLPFPLLLGFFAKVGLLIEIFKNHLNNIGILLALSSIFAIYIYSRLIPSLHTITSENKNSDKNHFILTRYFIILLTISYIIINLIVVKIYNFVTKLTIPF